MPHHRTTIIFPEELWKKVVERAKAEDKVPSEVVREAVRKQEARE